MSVNSSSRIVVSTHPLACLSAFAGAFVPVLAHVLRFEEQKFESAEAGANAKNEHIRLFRERCPWAMFISTAELAGLFWERQREKR